MAIDGILLYKIMPGIQNSLPARIQKIYEISNTEVLFQIHGTHGKEQLLISCHSVYNRMLLTKRSYPTPDEPGNFVMVLRKYLEGGTIESIEQAGLDRWCTLKIRRHNNLGDIEYMDLIVELMGKYANILLVNNDHKIIDVLKRIPPFENSKRIIMPNAVFEPMEPQDKKNPFITDEISTGSSLVKQFAGFSPLLAREIEFRMSKGDAFHTITKEIEASDKLYISSQNGEPAFHCIPLTHLGEYRAYPLFEGFDILYFHKEEKERIKQITGDLFHLAKRELKHQKIKLPRLLKEYDEALDCDKWMNYGNLLFTYNITDTKGKTEIYLEDYETEKEIRIPLDPKLDGRQNAKKCFTKYNKLKKGQKYLEEQIAITEGEITYFEGILDQLEQADFDTAGEIQQELVKLGYIKEKKNAKKKRRKKQEMPHVTTIETKDGIRISFGRNNLQNDTLTWQIAKKNEVWLHAKDYHGAHVVIHNEHPDEEVLRLAANIAAYFSKGRDSSSVPVNYCTVRTLKKIPGAKPGTVQLGAYKTIYIDPDPSSLEASGIVL